MAIRTFNSVGGFSVGETPETIILANGDITTDYATFTANASAGNLLTDHLLYANGVPWTFVTAGGVDTQVQFNDGGSSLGGNAGFTFNKTTTTVTANNFIVSSSANLGSNANVIITGGTDGYVLKTNGSGVLSWVNPSAAGIAGSNTQIQFNDGSSFGADANLTFNKTTDTLGTKNITLEALGSLSGGNLVSANYITGTLTTAAQPNITSVGTLSSLTVSGNANSGNIYTGNLNLTGSVTSSLLPGNDNTYDLGSSTYQWRNVYAGSNIFIGGTSAYIRAVGNVLYTDAANLANNLSAGSITSRGDALLQGNATISGNLTVSGTTTYVNVTNLSITDPIIEMGGSASGGNATSYDGKDRGMFLHNYTSGGGGVPINMFMGWDTSNVEFALGSNVSVSGEVITFNTFGNIRLNTVIGNLSGTVTTASQPSITSVGTLTSLNVSGTTTTLDANVTGTFKASGLTYPTSDGSTGQFLQTNGSGSLSWATVSTTSITNGTSNVNIGSSGGNVQLVSGGNVVANITSTGANVTGTLNVSGNTTVGAMIIGNSAIRAYSNTTSSTSNISFFTLAGSTFRAVEFFVKGEDSVGGKYSVATISAVHDASTVDYAVYGTVSVGGSTGVLALSYSTGILTLHITPASTNSTLWTIQYRTI